MATNTDIPSLVQAKKILGPYFPMLVKIISDAWQHWHTMTGYDSRFARATSRRTRASTINDFMADFAREYLDGKPGVALSDSTGFLTASFEGLLVLRFKKLTFDSRTSRNKTRQQEQFLVQISLPNYPEEMHLTVGYVLDRLGIKLEDIRLACEVKKDVVWRLSLISGDEITDVGMVNQPLRPDVGPVTQTKIAPKKKSGDAKSEGG